MTPPPDLIQDLISKLSVMTQAWRPKHRLVGALRAFSRQGSELGYAITKGFLFIRSFEDPKGPIGDAFFVHVPSDGDIPRWNEMEIAYMRQQGEEFRSTVRSVMPAPVAEIPELINASSELASPPISEDLRDSVRDLLVYFDKDLRKKEAIVGFADRYIGLCDEQLGPPKQAEPRWDRTKLAAMHGLADQFLLARLGQVKRPW
jgi:hypothetical protein